MNKHFKCNVCKITPVEHLSDRCEFCDMSINNIGALRKYISGIKDSRLSVLIMRMVNNVIGDSEEHLSLLLSPYSLEGKYAHSGGLLMFMLDSLLHADSDDMSIVIIVRNMYKAYGFYKHDKNGIIESGLSRNDLTLKVITDFKLTLTFEQMQSLMDVTEYKFKNRLDAIVTANEIKVIFTP